MYENAVATLLFYLFALCSVALAVMAVVSRRILRAAVYLMGALVCTAAFYLMLNAEFLAGVQVLVYVGGIAILIVFAVMLTARADLLEDKPALSRKLLGAASALSFFGLSAAAILYGDFKPLLGSGTPPTSDTAAIGLALLDYKGGGYVLPFEIISLLLLAVIIGGIVIARKTPPADQPFESVSNAEKEAGNG